MMSAGREASDTPHGIFEPISRSLLQAVTQDRRSRDSRVAHWNLASRNDSRVIFGRVHLKRMGL
jgi:hypothetical protein